MILLCHSILKKELNPLKDYFSLQAIVDSAGKAKNGLGEAIKGSSLKGTKLVKVYLTGQRGAGRIVHLLIVNKNYWIPIILRLKKDKMIGRNITINNPAFKKLLDKNMELVIKDLELGNYEELPL